MYSHVFSYILIYSHVFLRVLTCSHVFSKFNYTESWIGLRKSRYCWKKLDGSKEEMLEEVMAAEPKAKIPKVKQAPAKQYFPNLEKQSPEPDPWREGWSVGSYMMICYISEGYPVPPKSEEVLNRKIYDLVRYPSLVNFANAERR